MNRAYNRYNETQEVLNMHIYQITTFGTDYIQSNDIYEIASSGILKIFNTQYYEVNGVNYHSSELSTQVKINILIGDGFIRPLSQEI